MFKSTLTKNSFGETEELCLFKNPAGNTNNASFIFFEIEYNAGRNSMWEFYHNPIITNNGTIQSVIMVEGGVPTNTINLYKSPTVTTNGNPLRRFMIQSNTQEFSSRVPMIVLEPGNSILVRRLNNNSGLITNTWTWKEESI